MRNPALPIIVHTMINGKVSIDFMPRMASALESKFMPIITAALVRIACCHDVLILCQARSFLSVSVPTTRWMMMFNKRSVVSAMKVLPTRGFINVSRFKE